MRMSARAAGEEIQSGLEELIESAEALLDDLKDQHGEAAASLRERASATVKSARRRLADLRPDMEDLAARALRGTTGFVRRAPWRAVALGALVILAVGIFASGAGGSDD